MKSANNSDHLSNSPNSDRGKVKQLYVQSEPDDYSQFEPFKIYRNQQQNPFVLKPQSENLIVEAPSLESKLQPSIYSQKQRERHSSFEGIPLINAQLPIQIVSKENQQEDKQEIMEIQKPMIIEEDKINENSLTHQPKHAPFGFLKMMLQRRITLNFKNNLMERAYILQTKNMPESRQRLLQEEFTKKYLKNAKKTKHKQIIQNKALSPNLPQTLINRGITQINQYFQTIDTKSTFRVGVLEPGHKFIVVWEFLKIFLILGIFLWLPFNVSFEVQRYWEIIQIEIFMLTFFSCDIALKFNRGIIMKGQIVSQRKLIIKYYLQNEAIQDILSFVCICILFLTRIQPIPFVIIYFILNTAKINDGMAKIQEAFSSQGTLRNFLDLIKLILVVFIFAHIIACTWHYVGQKCVTNGLSWLIKYDLVEQSIGTRYNHSMYWAAMTMITVGYGDITPQNDQEMLMVNITMFIACGVFAFSVNSIGIVLQNINEGKRNFKKTMTLINNYMRKNSVGFELQSRVRNYLEYCFDQEKEINDEEISELIGKLSTKLKEELLFQVLNKALKSCKILSKNFSEDTQRKLACLMEPVRYCPEDKILIQDIVDDGSLFVIHKGEVVLFEEVSKKELNVLKKGESFGEFGFFTGRQRTCSVTALGFSRIYKIRRDSFLEIIKDNKQEMVIQNQNLLTTQEKYHQIKDQIMFDKSIIEAQTQCYCCGKLNHQIMNCPQLRYIPDLERIIKKDLFHCNQDRCKYFRRVRSAAVTKSLLNLKVLSHYINYLKFFQDKSKTFKNTTDISYESDHTEKSNNDGTYTNLVSMVNELESGIPRPASMLEVREHSTSILNQPSSEKMFNVEEEAEEEGEEEQEENNRSLSIPSLEQIINRTQNIRVTSGTAQFQQFNNDQTNLNALQFQQTSLRQEVQESLPGRRGKLVTLSEDIQPMAFRKERSELKRLTITAPNKSKNLSTVQQEEQAKDDNQFGSQGVIRVSSQKRSKSAHDDEDSWNRSESKPGQLQVQQKAQSPSIRIKRSSQQEQQLAQISNPLKDQQAGHIQRSVTNNPAISFAEDVQPDEEEKEINDHIQIRKLRTVKDNSVNQGSYHRGSSKIQTRTSNKRLSRAQSTRLSNQQKTNATNIQSGSPLHSDQGLWYESYNIDSVAIFRAYFPEYNIDNICKKLVKQSKKRRNVILKHENTHLSKYTFFYQVKARALRVMKIVNAQQKGVEIKLYNSFHQQSNNPKIKRTTILAQTKRLFQPVQIQSGERDNDNM